MKVMFIKTSIFFLNLSFCLTFISTLALCQESEGVPGAEYLGGFGVPDVNTDPKAQVDRSSYGSYVKSSVVVGDVDKNLANGLELFGGTTSGRIVAFRADGSLIWQYSFPKTLCHLSNTLYKRPPAILSSPALGKLDGKRYAVIVGYGKNVTLECTNLVSGGVIALDAQTGKVLWNFSTYKRTPSEHFYDVISTPALGDVDGDGKLEVGFGSLNRRIYILNSNGKVRLEYDGGGPTFSSPTFMNIDKSPDLEMIIGYDVSRNDNPHFKTKNGGLLIALKASLNLPNPSVFFGDKRVLLWRQQFEQTIWSSPSVGELLNSTKGPEIAIGSGCFSFSKKSKTAIDKGKFVSVVNPTNGKILKKLPILKCTAATPAIADLDGDGRNEIIISTLISGHYVEVMAIQPEDNVTLWTQKIGGLNLKSSDSHLGIMLESPIVADVDGNGSLEVLLTWGGRIYVFSANGKPLTCLSHRCGVGDNATLRVSYSSTTTPTAADVNNDGVIDVITAGAKFPAGIVGVTNLSKSIVSEPGPHPAFYSPWPMWRGNIDRSGFAP